MALLNFLVLINLIMGGLVFCSYREHLLMVLLSLEFMVLSIFFLFIIFMGGLSCFYSLIYLVVTACEGALGLSVLINMSRSHGGDYLKGMGLIVL